MCAWPWDITTEDCNSTVVCALGPGTLLQKTATAQLYVRLALRHYYRRLQQHSCMCAWPWDITTEDCNSTVVCALGPGTLLQKTATAQLYVRLALRHYYRRLQQHSCMCAWPWDITTEDCNSTVVCALGPGTLLQETATAQLYVRLALGHYYRRLQQHSCMCAWPWDITTEDCNSTVVCALGPGTLLQKTATAQLYVRLALGHYYRRLQQHSCMCAWPWDITTEDCNSTVVCALGPGTLLQKTATAQLYVRLALGHYYRRLQQHSCMCTWPWDITTEDCNSIVVCALGPGTLLQKTATA